MSFCLSDTLPIWPLEEATLPTTAMIATKCRMAAPSAESVQTSSRLSLKVESLTVSLFAMRSLDTPVKSGEHT